ncbi:L-lactate permease [Silvibacterium acidisoli]|uniref:L-lactate permease n=1 Tax=Acidobacteriaceae bacterium ZG23-2 TaxID=2883246 RepID=UPI00406CEF43
MIWNQTYILFGHGLLFSAAIASLPIVTLLLLLGVMRRPAWLAGLIGLAVSLLVAVFAYGMPLHLAWSAAAYGVAFGLFPISWIIFWAIALFRLTVETGRFDIIRDSVARLSPDPRLQALLIAFAFGAFLEGGAGFGTPVAIAATMLVGLGFSPFSASAICLLANTAPVAFGSIGIPIVTLAATTGLPVNDLSVAVGRTCAPLSMWIPLYVIVATAGWKSLKGIVVPVIGLGVVFAGVQFAVSNFLGPQLADILASLSSIAALLVYLRTARTEAIALSDEIRYCLEDSGAAPPALPSLPRAHSVKQILSGWMPYGFLVACVLLWGLAPVQAWLNSFTVTVGWPGLNDLIGRVPPITLKATPYHALYNLNLLSAAGTACMAATLLTAVVARVSPLRFCKLIAAVAWQLALPILTIVSVLAIAFVMNYCGATATLGLTFAATGAMFPFFSAMLGWLGVFLTGSDTASNALFGNLQVVTAGRLSLSPALMAGANSTGGVMGKMISLQTIAVAAAATGLATTQQSRLFRFTLKHSLLLAGATGLLAMIYTYAFHMR